MKKITTLIIALIAVFSTQAQVVNVCGTDSVTLTVENYVNGAIEWQVSIDTLTWVNIPEVSGETYKFLPTQTKYYRAMVKTSDCEPLYSAISLVQLTPIANAGTDRTIGNTSLTLLGNSVPGATGEWVILSGTGGIIDNSSNPRALFTGINKEKYILKWTLTNACGQSADTTAITFDEIVSKNNFIVVDNTDSLYSDSTEMANGTYRIKFSDPTIVPYDSVMLIGMRSNISFLQKVISFTLQDSIYTFSTVEGSFEELIKAGVLNMGDALNQSIILDSPALMKMNSSSLVLKSTFPTRETLNENKDNKGIKLLFSQDVNPDGYLKVKSSINNSNKEGLVIPLPDATIFEIEGYKNSISNSYIRIDPNFVLDFAYSFPAKLTKLRFGIDNGEYEYNFCMKTEVTLPIAKAFTEKKIFGVTKILVFMAGPIPVEFTANIDINASMSIKSSAGLKFEQTKNYLTNFTAMVVGENSNDLTLIKNSTETSTNEEKFMGISEFSSVFKIGPEISFKAYDFVGPYFKMPAKIGLSVCANTNHNWSANASIGYEWILGANAKVLGYTLFDFNYSFLKDNIMSNIKLPYQLELISGNFQKGTAGKKLNNQIVLKAKSHFGFGIPLVPVHLALEAGNGSVANEMLFTDALGNVYIDWTLGANPQNKLKVSVLDCNDNDIENSPVYIYASSTSQSSDCTNSSLSIDMKTANGYMSPTVTGGISPYTYSTNGTDYSATKPQFNILIPLKQTIFVKDKNLCIRSRTFEIKAVDACASSTLSLDVINQPNILTITGKGGTSPYQYAIDNNTSFSSVTTYSNLTAGVHTIYVKDAKGCIISSEVKIDANTKAAIKATYPANGASYIPITELTFQWVAATYTTNQSYDLYLKKGTDAYKLIASNLNTPSFTYSTALLANTAYTWKVEVKGSAGTVLDYSEFTFTTASGVTTAPTTPFLIEPNNGYITPGLTATLKWTSQVGDFKYDVYMDTNDASTLVALNVINPEYTVNKLVSGKTYYWKVKIKSTTTSASTFSAVRCFSVLQNNNTVTDIDGNVYNTVTIGTQTWMVDNLKTSKYRNGEPIPNVTENAAWSNLTTGAWCNYNNDVANGTKYGKLYNWYAVADTRNIAPAGWHIPTDAEWTILENYLITNSYNYDGTTTDSKIAKSLAANTDWITSTNLGAIGNDLSKNNTSGFSALPGGCQAWVGSAGIGGSGGWHTSTDYGTGVYSRGLDANFSSLMRGNSVKNYGNSVRCVKDASIPIPEISTALIPAGTFTMGSPETEVDRASDETQHQVTLSAFRMSKYEITNAQFATFLNAKSIGSDGIYAAGAYPTQVLINASSGLSDWGLNYIGGQWIPVSGYENYPVINVTWYGASEYATFMGGALPTEAQWEYACRAGTTTPFNTGDCLTSLQANYNWVYPYSTCTNTVTTYPGKTQAVGSYAPNGYGLYDMHGNVWEWCLDWYDKYPNTNQVNPSGSTEGTLRVLRGGNWGYDAVYCRSARRIYQNPLHNDFYIGFRLVYPPTSENPQTVTDIDGNIYNTVTIGTQTWMVENLKTTRYRNGDAIGTTTASMPNDATSKYQWAYGGNEANVAKYGRLYNWYAATDTRNLAPSGWHVPTDAEWTTLETYLIANGYNFDGTTTGNKIAKALAATTDWKSYIVAGTIGCDLTKNNSTGFTALPCGDRNSNGTFTSNGNFSLWLSSTKDDATYAPLWTLNYQDVGLYRGSGPKIYGFSVRCIRD